MDSLLRDLRAAFRALTRRPGVTALAIASLGLAIGFSTAAFSVLDAYALRDLPVRDPRQLVSVSALTREQRSDRLSWVEYQALGANTHAFSGIVSEDRRGPGVKLPDRDDFPITAGVSDNYFDVLGIRAAQGELFHAGTGIDGIVVLSDRYWRRAFGSDPGILGRTLPVGSGMLRIVAVLPPAFLGVNRGTANDLFVPMQAFFGSMRMGNPGDARSSEYEAIGRLRPGASLDQARGEIDAVLRQLERDGRQAGPDRKAGLELFAAKGFREKIESNAIFLGVMVLLILIAAVNLANLRLVDNESRRRETGIRLALGASRADLGRRHLMETFLLSALGTIAGLLLAAWLIRAAPALFYAGQKSTDYGIRVDFRTFAFSSLALLTVAAIGAAIPWSDAWRKQISPALQSSRTAGSSSWLSGLVIAQMVLVTAITCSAGLLWRSLENVAAIRPAMNPDGRMLLLESYLPAGEVNSSIDTLARGLSGLPGVERVAWARRAHLSGSLGGATVGVEVAGQPRLQFHYNLVSPSYFETTGARVLGGRAFLESDSATATPVVMVTPAFVRRFFTGRQPVGEWVRISGKDRQIAGIVEDGPVNGLREISEPYVYFPFAQRPDREFTFFVTTRKDPGGLADTVRSYLRNDAKELIVFDMHTLRLHMRHARSTEQLAAGITGGLAVISLLLAAAGLFGVSLYAVSRRTPEFGVRVAMGASPGRLMHQVLRESARRIAIALPIGWTLSWLSRHAIEKLLYGVAADDPWTFALASLAVTAVGSVAALHPAIRASRIDPITALRHE